MLRIMVEDHRQQVEYLNPAFLRMWGINECENLLGLPTQTVLERSTKHFVKPSHVTKYVLTKPVAHEISERFELELTDGRMLTQLSYPVDDIKKQTIG